jgi:hypothetical protein
VWLVPWVGLRVDGSLRDDIKKGGSAALGEGVSVKIGLWSDATDQRDGAF